MTDPAPEQPVPSERDPLPEPAPAVTPALATADSVHWVDVAIRLAMLGGLLGWSAMIVRPFLGLLVWGGVLAVALYPAYARVERMLGNRHIVAAVLFVVVPLALLLVPTGVLVATLVDDVALLNAQYTAGELNFPEPMPEVRDWPVVGTRIHDAWKLAHDDLGGALTRYTPQVDRLRTFAVSAARDVIAGAVGLLFSLIVMGVLLATSKTSGRALRALIRRIDPTRGDGLVSLARDTTRSVARGIVGVALVQSLLGGLGCLVAGVPMAGIWTVLVLVCALAQLPTLLVLGPIAGYLFMNAETWIAIVFTVWTVFVGLIDNVLKPLLLGRGVEVPMLVVFSGVLGGVLLQGIVGLFVGPVVLAMSYTLIRAWVRLGEQDTGTAQP